MTLLRGICFGVQGDTEHWTRLVFLGIAVGMNFPTDS